MALITAVVLRSSLRRTPSDHALLVHKSRGTQVLLEGSALVIPALMHSELLDLRLKRVTIERQGTDGVHCRDGVRVDVKAVFFVRVNRAREDILQVARSVGAARATDPTTLEELFTARVSEALKAVISQFEVEELLQDIPRARDQLLEQIGVDLNGYILDDLALDKLAQTPSHHLDPENILDARGLRKIAQLKQAQEQQRLEIEKEMAVQRAQQERQVKELMLEFETQQAQQELQRKQHKAETLRHQELLVAQLEEQARREHEKAAQAHEAAALSDQHQRDIEHHKRVIAWERQKAMEELEIQRVAMLAEVERLRLREIARMSHHRKTKLRRDLLRVLQARVDALSTEPSSQEPASQGPTSRPAPEPAHLPGLSPWKL
jgi:uncharacterized membrane protein YqiK